MANADFVKLMQELQEDRVQVDGPTVEKQLCWINIGGINWDVISALALRYDLHSLALEDILHEQGHNQSNADYYQQHLSANFVLFFMTEEDGVPGPEPVSEYPESTRRPPKKDAEIAVDPLKGHELRHHISGLVPTCGRQQQMLRIAALTQGDRVNVKHEPVFIFLLHDGGNYDSIHTTPNLEFTQPVTERIYQHDSVLRTSEDPSILVEALFGSE
ncbi:hypothetical protein B0H10DRAFT_2217781 [Mycena sp. CBHHK59/15]|nr:hypothetical protein B0H10DRAFT_2217781 [Mycena sp. CBHHK59/15]